MRSLRTRLVLISTLVSGLAIAGVSGLSWYFMRRAVLESVDLRVAGIGGRLIRDMHPRADWDLMREHIEITHGDDIEDGEVILHVRDEVNDLDIFSSVDDFAAVETGFPPGFPEDLPLPRRRPEWALDPEGGRPPLRGEGGKKGERPPPYHRGGPRPPRGERDGRPDEDDPYSSDLRGSVEEAETPPGGGLSPGDEDGDPPRRPDAKAPPPHPDHRHEEFVTIRYEGKNWRLVVNRERGFRVVAAVDLTRSRTELAQLEGGLLIGIPLAIALIGFGGWLVADRAMRPIRNITDTASRITARDLSARIPEYRDNDPEISRLTDVLNGMMDRIEKSFSHATRFSSDVSHELKTPISVMQAEIETALRECRPGTAEENRLLVLREETSRLKSITRSLMLLAQADVGELIRKAEPVNVSEELASLAEDAEILAEGAHVSIESQIDPEATILGDPVLLRQALLNLINNAIKYNSEGGFVRLELKKSEEGIRIAVANSGTGISAEERAKVFDRFFRADQARSRGVHGFGLGLSLAKAVIEGHGGTIALVDAGENVTRFEVELPAIAD